MACHLSSFSLSHSYKKITSWQKLLLSFFFFPPFWALGSLAASCPMEGWCQSTGGWAGAARARVQRPGEVVAALPYSFPCAVLADAIATHLPVPANIFSSKGNF